MLLELCYSAANIPIQEGVCLYLKKDLTKLDSFDCRRFEYGCPTSFYTGSTIYIFPSCTTIRNGCFLDDLSCKSAQTSTQKTAADKAYNEPRNWVLIFVPLGASIMLIVFGCLLYILYRRRGCRRGKQNDFDHQWNSVVEDKRSSITSVDSAEGQRSSDIDAGSLENLLSKDFHRMDFKDHIIHYLSQNKMKALYDLSKRFDVKVDIDKDQGKVVLFGPKDEISAASDSVHTILREADRHIQNKAQAKLISDYVQWYYINTDGTNDLVEYPDHVNLVIEKAYRNQDTEVKLYDTAGVENIINLNNMEEYPSDDMSDVATVARRVKIRKSSFEPPKEWKEMKEDDYLEVVTINSGTSEYSGVIDRFKGQAGPKQIVKLERIQNKMLYQQYLAKKKLLDSQNPKGTKNERELWHGTAPEAVNSINSFGFNRSYCGKNSTACGEGVYFDVGADYSSSDSYSRPDSQGHKRVYLCNVLTGEYTQGQSGMRVPPQKPGQQPHILYDSVVNNTSSPAMFIVFNYTQAYPAYLITFKKFLSHRDVN